MDELFLVSFKEDSCYETKCILGHETKLFLHDPKYQILFEIGAHAIIDGYYREAVSSFTASLERFYEYSLRVFLQKDGHQDLFQQCWKQVSKQSERQLGAFIYLWALNFGKAPDLLSSNQTGFRNDVIHNGKIPTREEAVNYGNAVLAAVQPMTNRIREQFAKDVNELDIQNCKSLKRGDIVVIGMANTINIASAKRIKVPSLEENLIRIEKQRGPGMFITEMGTLA